MGVGGSFCRLHLRCHSERQLARVLRMFRRRLGRNRSRIRVSCSDGAMSVVCRTIHRKSIGCNLVVKQFALFAEGCFVRLQIRVLFSLYPWNRSHRTCRPVRKRGEGLLWTLLIIHADLIATKTQPVASGERYIRRHRCYRPERFFSVAFFRVNGILDEILADRVLHLRATTPGRTLLGRLPDIAIYRHSTSVTTPSWNASLVSQAIQWQNS